MHVQIKRFFPEQADPPKFYSCPIRTYECSNNSTSEHSTFIPRIRNPVPLFQKPEAAFTKESIVAPREVH